MSKPKRFRDMSLTASDVETLIHANAALCERKLDWLLDPGTGEEELDNSELETFVERAQRLLPLWRKWGLRDLQTVAHAVGAAFGSWVPPIDHSGVATSAPCRWCGMAYEAHTDTRGTTYPKSLCVGTKAGYSPELPF